MIADSPKDTAQFFSNVLTLSMDDAKVGMPDDITATMVSMWKDPAIKDLYQTYGDLFPQTSAYFLDKLATLLEPSYVMSKEDMLLMRTVTQNISDNIFDVDMNGKTQRLHFFDVSGLKYHRKRWMSYFDDILSIVFVVAISSFDQVLSEDKDVNRMVDAIKLFDFIVNHPLLTKPDIILFFNKKDLYDVKIKRTTLKTYFPTYAGREFSASEGINFFQQEFLKVNKNEKKMVKVHITCCTDTKMMEKIIKDVLFSILKGELGNVVSI
ncbi:guanine nucleotide binding protein, alpha subunit [Globomyces pollinis-pini]|nr:guanine nucleotide binding protein, alpha subunit [Globomyces pollinis-pini]